MNHPTATRKGITTINFTRAKLDELKQAYTKAKQKGAEQFEFEGHPLLVAYAKYLIQYLEGAFKPDTKFLRNVNLENL